MRRELVIGQLVLPFSGVCWLLEFDDLTKNYWEAAEWSGTLILVGFTLVYCCLIIWISLICVTNVFVLHVFVVCIGGLNAHSMLIVAWCGFSCLGPGPVLLLVSVCFVCVRRYANLAGGFALRLAVGCFVFFVCWWRAMRNWCFAGWWERRTFLDFLLDAGFGITMAWLVGYCSEICAMDTRRTSTTCMAACRCWQGLHCPSELHWQNNGASFCVGRMGDWIGRTDHNGEWLLRVSASRPGWAGWFHKGHWPNCRGKKRALHNRECQLGCQERYGFQLLPTWDSTASPWSWSRGQHRHRWCKYGGRWISRVRTSWRWSPSFGRQFKGQTHRSRGHFEWFDNAAQQCVGTWTLERRFNPSAFDDGFAGP